MRSNKRKAFTLIEMVVVVSTLCVLASTSLVVLNALERLRQASIAQTSSVRETQRFADALRHAARSASSAEIDGATSSLLLTDSNYEHRFTESTAGKFIDYVGTPRTSDSGMRHDRFMIGLHSNLEFNRVDELPLISVQWKRELGVPTDLRIEALLADSTQVERESP